MPRFELFPDSCREWSGAQRYAESLVAGYVVDRQTTGHGDAIWNDRDGAAAVVACLALGAYLGSMAGITRSVGLHRALEISETGKRLGIVERALNLEGSTQLVSSARAAVDLLLKRTIDSPQAAVMIMGAAAVVVGSSPDRGFDEANEPIEVPEYSSDGKRRDVARRPDELVTFDKTGWSDAKHLSAGGTVWRLPNGVGVHVGVRVPGRVAIPPEIQDLDELRMAFRSEVRGAVEMVALDIVDIAGGQGVEEILRVPLEADELMAYQGELTLPFENVAIVIRASASTSFVTASERDRRVRESAVAAGLVQTTADGDTGWRPHEGLDATLADDPAHDITFPQHPLSLVRSTLAGIRGSLVLHPALGGDEPWIPILDD